MDKEPYNPFDDVKAKKVSEEGASVSPHLSGDAPLYEYDASTVDLFDFSTHGSSVAKVNKAPTNEEETLLNGTVATPFGPCRVVDGVLLVPHIEFVHTGCITEPAEGFIFDTVAKTVKVEYMKAVEESVLEKMFFSPTGGESIKAEEAPPQGAAVDLDVLKAGNMQAGCAGDPSMKYTKGDSVPWVSAYEMGVVRGLGGPIPNIDSKEQPKVALTPETFRTSILALKRDADEGDARAQALWGSLRETMREIDTPVEGDGVDLKAQMHTLLSQLETQELHDLYNAVLKILRSRDQNPQFSIRG